MKNLLIPAVVASLLSLSTPAGALPATASSPNDSAAARKPVAAKASKKSIAQADACARTGVLQTTDDKSAARRESCDDAFDGLDRALNDGARYDLAPTTLAALETWRRTQFLDDATAALPWHVGPAHLEIFPALAPVDIPAGYQVLLPAEVAAATKDTPGHADSGAMPIALVIVDAGRTVVTLSMQATGTVRKEKLAPDALLQTLAARGGHGGMLLPTAQSPEEAIARTADRVEWIKAPAPDAQGDRNDWIYTTGHHSDPTVTVFAMPEIAARWVLLGAKETLVADYKGNAADTDVEQAAARFGTVWNALAFQPGARYADAAASAPASGIALGDLVTRSRESGQAAEASDTPDDSMAKGFANMMRRDEEERSAKMGSLFWKAMILAVPLIGLLLRKLKSL